MVEVTSAVPLVVSSSIKKTATKPSKPRAKPSHPPTSQMVKAAIFSLRDHRGSSLQAIKKYIMNNYGLSTEKMTPLVRRYIKLAVINGKLIRTKGKGASGSFKLPPENQDVQIKSSKTSMKEKNPRKNSKINVAENTKSMIAQKSVISIRKSVSKISKSTNIDNKIKEMKPEVKMVDKKKLIKKHSPKVKKNHEIIEPKRRGRKPNKILSPQNPPKKK